MADSHTAGAVRFGRQVAFAAFNHRYPAPQRGPKQLIGLFLRPAQPAGFAKYLKGQPMLATERNGRCPQPPDGAAIHAEIDHRVILQHPGRNG